MWRFYYQIAQASDAAVVQTVQDDGFVSYFLVGLVTAMVACCAAGIVFFQRRHKKWTDKD